LRAAYVAYVAVSLRKDVGQNVSSVVAWNGTFT